MCTNILARDFRNTLAQVSSDKAGLVTLYLKTVGAVADTGDGKISLVTNIDLVDCAKKLVAKISDGDLAWVFNQGFVLVIDTHPRANDDGHHCRVIKVKLHPDGRYSIDSSERSVIVQDIDMLRIRRTSFDMKAIGDLTYERYKLCVRLSEINDKLDEIRESETYA